MNKWIAVETAKPMAEIGEHGKPPIISDNVLAYMGPPDGDGTITIAAYDHDEHAWDVFTGFHEYAPAHPDPTHWMPLPDAPQP